MKIASIAAWAVIVICVAKYVDLNCIILRPTDAPSDFRWYYLAADHVLDGNSPYLSSGYIYPPLLALIVTPLAYLDYLPARWIWFVFSHACLLTAAWLTWRKLGSTLLAATIIAVVWAFGGAAGESLAYGQVGPQLTLLLAAAYTLKPRGAGACIGTGMAVKFIPGVLYLILALERNVRALLASIGLALFLSLASWCFVYYYLSGPLAPPQTDYLAGTPSVLSWSLPSVALRIYEPFRIGDRMPIDWITGTGLETLKLAPGQRIISLSVAAVTLLLGCWFLARRVHFRLASEQVPLASAAMLALALAASPVCWPNYQVMEYPGVALLLGYAARMRIWSIFGAAAITAALLYPIPVTVLRAYYYPANAWPSSPAIMYFWTSIPVAASIVLFVLMLRPLSAAKTPRYSAAVA